MNIELGWPVYWGFHIACQPCRSHATQASHQVEELQRTDKQVHIVFTGIVGSGKVYLHVISSINVLFVYVPMHARLHKSECQLCVCVYLLHLAHGPRPRSAYTCTLQTSLIRAFLGIDRNEQSERSRLLRVGIPDANVTKGPVDIAVGVGLVL